MSRTPDSAARCPKPDEQPTLEEQALEDQLTQEQFDNKVEKDLEVMLTQEQCDKEEGPEGEAAEGEEEEDDDDDDSEEGYESPEDPSHVKPEGGQQRKIWTRILTQTRR